MIWAIDQDDGDFDALAGVIGEDLSVIQVEGGGLSGDAANDLADAFAAYTGQNGFITPRCIDGSSGEKNPDQVCPSGYMSVSTAHNPLQAGNKELHGDCSEGWYQHICCPKDAMPRTANGTVRPSEASSAATVNAGGPSSNNDINDIKIKDIQEYSLIYFTSSVIRAHYNYL
ncbi:uncharacterized protein AKAW2_21613S [Aspergillus luchuensis]|nr:uncharacterized protein AKAW2_21613S [Aspergillus luchuensis]BCR96673.1 hypothetical protein AKAW2_21613S [Aspergillus luchuensis]BCS09175.1 hypothetical protein ALUC_21545S [Aspergillus luchuensis]